MKMASMAEENQFLRHELALAKNKADEREHTWCKENRALMDQNDTLQSRLRDLESVLIEYKVKYAECNDNYEIIQEKLFQVQKSI
jgi:hypothetical protein